MTHRQEVNVGVGYGCECGPWASYSDLQIQSASISTYGTRVTDIFYVKDFFGQKIQDEKSIKKVKSELLNILNKTKNL